jgi:3-oxoacyl-[acyl-carrier protein] reductase
VGTLDGKVALVTAGGGRGMGSAISRQFAAEGAAIVIADIDAESAERVAADIRARGGRALAVPTDVSNAGDVERMVARAVAEFGPVSVLANHAGIRTGGPIEEMTEAQWDRALGVHLKGAFLCSRAIVPHMKAQGWGRIISTASRAAYRPMPITPGLVDYSAAKAGLIGFSHALAMEVGRYGITVNVIAPGMVMNSGMSDRPPPTPEEERRISEAEGQVLPPRYVRPDEIAAAYVYLAGPGADRITGAVLHINGGSYFSG